LYDLDPHSRAMLLNPRASGVDNASMSTPRQLRPIRFRRGAVRPEVEEVEARIRTLVAERQELRAAAPAPGRLEANRVELARAQWELSHALLERHRAA
jgi:hypothetical protein